jgi:hypothetical protein
MRRISAFLIISVLISASILAIPVTAYAVESSTNLMIIEWYGRVSVIFPTDDSSTNPDMNF